MIRLLDNNKPARYPETKVDSPWDNCDFRTMNELIDYADRWLGSLSPGITELKNSLEIVGTYHYGGCGDYLSIVNDADLKAPLREWE